MTDDTPSTRHFAFIRAINVGGRRLTNDELMEPFVQLGLSDVAAYQAAGNITFCSEAPDAASVDRLESAATEAYGFEAAVFVRSEAEMRSVARVAPFSEAEVAATDGRIQVSFLQAPPNLKTIAEVKALVPAGERSVFIDREWFWLPVAGISDSSMPVSAVERLIGPMTMRTLGTVQRMHAKFA